MKRGSSLAKSAATSDRSRIKASVAPTPVVLTALLYCSIQQRILEGAATARARKQSRGGILEASRVQEGGRDQLSVVLTGQRRTLKLAAWI